MLLRTQIADGDGVRLRIQVSVHPHNWRPSTEGVRVCFIFLTESCISTVSTGRKQRSYIFFTDYLILHNDTFNKYVKTILFIGVTNCSCKAITTCFCRVNESSQLSRVWFVHCRVHGTVMTPVTSERCPLTRMRTALSTLSLHTFLQLMEAPLVVFTVHQKKMEWLLF